MGVVKFCAQNLDAGLGLSVIFTVDINQIKEMQELLCEYIDKNIAKMAWMMM